MTPTDGVECDVLIIGAGMSGLAAGVRLAQFDRRVLIVDRHTVFGGLNSFYTLGGRRFDVGLHALTNFVPPGVRQAPLAKLLRQLRLSRDVLQLCPQRESRICFPGVTLRFGNDPQQLIDEIRRAFPGEIDRVVKLLQAIRSFDDLNLANPRRSARAALADQVQDPLLIDMLLCPLMYYGSAEEQDMDWSQFVVLFKSIFLEGLARPRAGVRRFIAELVKRFREVGGQLRMGCGVRGLQAEGGRITAAVLDDGSHVRMKSVLSSAGLVETMRLCPPGAGWPQARSGRLSFVESISVLDQQPQRLGLDATIIFFNDERTFTYRRPDELIDDASGVICCPNNYEGHDDMDGVVRVTSLANYPRWAALSPQDYALAKVDCYHRAVERAVRYIPEFRPHVVYRDIFTPLTIQRFTGHVEGSVYGTADKIRDGRTPYDNLFVCGTDQGFLGIIGACLSGVTIANLHVLAREAP